MLIKGLLKTGLIAGIMMTSALAHAQTVGPNGETATPSAEITLSDAEFASLKEKGLKAALLWHTSSDFINAVSAGATDEFAKAGVSIAVTTDA